MKIIRRLLTINQFTSIVLFIIGFFLFNASYATAQDLNYLSEESQKIHRSFWACDSLIFKQLMKNTPYQTPVFLFDSQKNGSVVLIVGGTHGDEPAGCEAAHRLLSFLSNVELLQGKIFIIPEANKIAVSENKRRIPVPQDVDREKGNLNRCFPGDSEGLPMEQMAHEVTNLIRSQQVELFMDLHESKFYHLETTDDSEEFNGLGQTLIFTVNEQAAWLGMVAVDHLNSSIEPGIKRFTLVERPVKFSAAWFAGELFGIPAFTVETCRKLPLEERIYYQLEAVKIMLEDKGVIVNVASSQ
ncbi:MAG TPA: hypothetical protein ENN22_07105 [bacterium]|nr:hypothetical protein [bacterium]